jgi:arylsulfatase A-like enzyme
VDVDGYNPYSVPSSSEAGCKALCESRLDCAGYSWRAADPTHQFYRHCFLVSADGGAHRTSDSFRSSLCHRPTSPTTQALASDNGSYTGDLFAAEAVRVITSHDQRTPLFLYLALHNTHAPLEAPWRFVRQYVALNDTKREAANGTRTQAHAHLKPHHLQPRQGTHLKLHHLQPRQGTHLKPHHLQPRQGTHLKPHHLQPRHGTSRCCSRHVTFGIIWLTRVPIPYLAGALFSGMLSFVDETVANVTAALRASGLWANTLLVWTTDNGSPVNAGGSNHPLRGGKGSNWEGGTRVPAFVNGGFLPDVQRGKTHAGLIHIADW